MPIYYKFDILAALKEKGFSSYRIRKDKLLGESTLQSLRFAKASPYPLTMLPAFVKCWTASPVISCIIIRKPPRALASKKAAGSFKTGPCTFRSRSPLVRILLSWVFQLCGG